jgi:hypothetical protein
MANTVNLLSYANTYGDWMVTTNNLVKENNNFASGLYVKDTGTLYLNDPTLGLQVTSNAIFASQMQVQGIGSGAYIQNNLRVGGTIELTNTSTTLTSNGIIYANGANTGLVVSNNAIISGNLTIVGRLFSTQGDVTSYVDTANAFLQANDSLTLTAAKNYTDSTNTAIFSSINTRINTGTANVTTLIDANNAMAYVKGIVVGDGGFSVGGTGSSSGGLSLDGTTVSNGSIIFPATTGTVSANVSIRKDRSVSGGINAEIKYNSTKLYWEISSLGPTANFPTKYTNDNFYRILTSEVLSDSVNLDFTTPSGATYAASANAANTLNNSIQLNNLFAQAAFNAANNAANVANAGFNTANNAQDSWVREYANAAFDKANSANILAQNAYNTANTGLSTAQLAYTAANNALDLWVRGQANAAYNIGQSAFNYANTVGEYSTSAYARANASLNSVIGTTGSAAPDNGIISFVSDNGVTVVGSGNVLTVNTSQDLRTTASPTFDGLTLTNALAVTQGGTGATSTAGALDSLLPASTGVGQVLATNGLGSYFWTSSDNVSAPGSTPGSIIRTSRLTYTGNGTGNSYLVPSYVPGSGQLRVYIDGVRQHPSEYRESNSVIVSFNTVTNNFDNSPKPGTNILFEVDGYANTTYYANNTAFTPNTYWTGTNANTVQLVIDAIIGNVAWRNNVVLSNTPQSVTAHVNTSNTMIATTAFVKNALNSGNTFSMNIAGNAATVTNGIYTNQSYSDPSWITAIANNKISGFIRSSQIANVNNTQVVGVFTSANLNTLLTTNINAPHGNATFTPVITVDAAGRVTAVSNVKMAIPASSVSGLLLSSANLTGTGVVASTYGNTTFYPSFTVDANGRVTGASNVYVSVANTQITGRFSSANLTNTGVTIATGNLSSITFGNSTYIPVITVDPAGRITAVSNTAAQPDLPNLITAGTFGNTNTSITITVDAKGRITSVTNTFIRIPSTQVTGLFSSANLTTTGVLSRTYGNTTTYPIITVDDAGRITAASNGNLIIPSTQVTGLFSSANLTTTGVTVNTYGNTAFVPSVTVDAAGRVTAISNVIIRVANTQVTGVFTSANLNNSGVTAASYGGAGYVSSFAVDAAGRITSATNVPISLPTANLTGTISAAQHGTTAQVQFGSVGVGVAANTTVGSLNIVQNSFAKIGNTYISSGSGSTNYAHFSNHTWYNGSWTADSAATTGSMYQMVGNTHNWFKSAGTTFTSLMSLDPSGNLVSLGNMTAFGSPSDVNLKENIVRIDTALDKITNINGYYYNYKSDANKTRLLGVIAQEIQPIVPEVVYDFTPLGAEQTSKAVRYEHLTVLLIEAIKELNQQVKDLKHEVDVLKGKQ